MQTTMSETTVKATGSPQGWAHVTSGISATDIIALRYETRYQPATGITAVVNQEQKVFHRRGVVVAPWCPRMKKAQDALANGLVKSTGASFEVQWDGQAVPVQVFEACAPGVAPIVYLGSPGFFDGVESPYDTSDLASDAVFFGLAADGLLRLAKASPRQFIWGADWQCVPALLLVRPRHHIAITLHNVFDAYLSSAAQHSGRGELEPLRGKGTALTAILELADVVTTVNRGFAYGLPVEVFHRRVMADHLQKHVGRIVGIDNANFEELSPAHAALALALEKDLASGVEQVQREQESAARSLPDGLGERVRGKVLCVSMGRRSSQKLHDVVVESVRELLVRDRSLPIFVYFATTHGDEGSPARLELIKELCAQFPHNTAWSNGLIPYFSQLMAAASYNILCSLWAPHEGAFQGTIVPVARAIDGLAAQVCPLQATGEAARLAALWHSPGKTPSGITFREAAGDEESTVWDLKGLLTQSPSPKNGTFWRMAGALTESLRQAVEIRRNQPLVYGRLVLGALEEQLRRSWQVNLGGMLSLMDEARGKRALG